MSLSSAVVYLPHNPDTGENLMLSPVLFTPPAQWLSMALAGAGVTRFFVLCREEDMAQAAPLFPPDAQLVTVGSADAAAALIDFLAGEADKVAFFTQPVLLHHVGAAAIVGESAPSRGGDDCGAWRISAQVLADALRDGTSLDSALKRGESLTHAVTPLGEHYLARAKAEEMARALTAAHLMEHGVTILDHNAVYVAPTVTVAPGATLLPGAILRGNTTVGRGSEIGPNTMVIDCHVGEDTTVAYSQCTQSTIGSRSHIGPFAYIRPHCVVGDEVKVGDFVELKNSNVGNGTKISHLTYVGDSDVGEHINFGCGTVTVNYDGASKFRTKIGDHAFIGCNTNLVAPVAVGEGAYIAAGSTITQDVPADSLAIARAKQTIKVQWAKKRRGK